LTIHVREHIISSQHQTIRKTCRFDGMFLFQKRGGPMAGSDVLQQIVRKRDRVDKLLQGAVPELIASTTEGLQTRPAPTLKDARSTFSRAWSAEGVAPGMLTRAICSATLYRVWTLRRRFEWLNKGESREALNKATQSSAALFHEPGPMNFKKYSRLLTSAAYGALNPLTSSQVFRVLVYGGEQRTHTGLGILAFFAMVWSLRRQYPNKSLTGARLEPWHPTAYVTAKCLFPIQKLIDVCSRRAELFNGIATSLKQLNSLASGETLHARWNFACELSQLSSRLSQMSRISLITEEFSRKAVEVAKMAGRLQSTTRSQDIIQPINRHIVSLLNTLGGKSRKSHKSATKAVEKIHEDLLPLLQSGNWEALSERGISCLTRPVRDYYWTDQVSAAKYSLRVCDAAVSALDSAATACTALPKNSDSNNIVRLLRELARSNRTLSSRFEDAGLDAAKWCLSLVEREMAYATASNDTDFDPAELVSALTASVRWRTLTNPPTIAAAVRTAITGARGDGSWASGQPFYTAGRALVAHPITSDMVWTLATAVQEEPEIHAADECFDQYVGWLERTATQETVSSNLKIPTFGWGSEKSRERGRIALWPTALAINALLEIRDLLELRVWQLCQDNFVPVRNTTSLAALDPVDLDAVHRSRLHARMIEMASEAANDDTGEAAYSFVFHGPPGSSKTAMAQALAGEMWPDVTTERHSWSNLVRITPADFTKHGEDRIESEARHIFDMLRHVRQVVILFDEVDDLLRKRSPAGRLTYLELLTPAMLNRLADLRDACPRQQICFIFSTNFVDQIEPALLRRGRIDEALPVVYPDGSSRALLVEKMLRSVANSVRGGMGRFNRRAFIDEIVKETEFWPWMHINDLLKEMKPLLRRPRFQTNPKELNEVLNSHRSFVHIPPYEATRLANLKESPDLRKELLQYTFAGWNSGKSYRKEFVSWLNDRGLKIDLSDGLKLQDTGIELWKNQGRPMNPAKK
jgi:hypothetical protein